jgi:diguanylate cyclase (GGDEF)-like protein/PAS domain S-box-containing protein
MAAVRLLRQAVWLLQQDETFRYIRRRDTHGGGEYRSFYLARSRVATSCAGRPLIRMTDTLPPRTAALATKGRSTVLDAVPAGIFETDPDGQCRFVNRRWQAYAGLSAEAARGSGWVEAIHPADREFVVAEWQAAVLASREFALEFRFLRPDGTTLWATGNASPIRAANGRLTGYIGTVTDVSAVVAERQEQADERRFADAVLDIAGALVCVFDGDGRILRFNRACELLTGYSFEEVRGRPFYEFLVPAAEIDAVREDLAQLRPGQPPTQNENSWITRDGRVRLISWSDVCFFDDEGRATHLISTGIDVTDERRGDEALRGIEAVGTLLAKTGSTVESMAAVLATLSGRMGYPYLSLFIRRGSRFELGAAIGYEGRAVALDPKVGIIGRVVRTGRSAFLERAQADVGAEADWRAASSDVASQVAVPLKVDGQTVGVLSVESTLETSLTRADLRLIETVAERLSVALVLGREQEALKERARLFGALNAFAQAAGAMVDEDLLCSTLLDGIAGVVPHDASWLTLLAGDGGRHVVRAVRGDDVDPLAVGRDALSYDGPAARAIERRALVAERHVADRSKRARLIPWKAKSGSMVAVPLIHDGAVLGTFVVGRVGPDAAFTELEREVLTLLGAQVALAAANARLLAEVHALAIRDPLTGLFNRRHFDAAVEHMFARWRRDREDAKPIAAIMFDLDHFGLLNNTYGHQAGDAVLREFSGILLTRFRSADLVARYGGEEFVVVLDGSTVADAAQVAEEIRRDLEARVVRGPDGQDVRTTVSAGCAQIDPANATREALIETADVALFAAKRAGRNRVISA